MMVRAATPEDAEAIAHVHVTTWQAAYRGTVPDDYLHALDVAGHAQMWRRGLSTGASSVVLAVEDDGAVTGFVAFGPHRGEADSGEVYALYVRPDRWRSGAGSALMAAAEVDLRERGFGTARLWVIDGNERAQGFYEQCGWMPDGARRDEEIGGAVVPQVRYHRRLEPWSPGMGEDRDRLRADCARCVGLCCVAPAFVASTDFAVTKPAGTPCRHLGHLGPDSRCEIHPWLRERGYAGCTVYDCFGAGQQISQVTFVGESWRDDERVASAMFTAFPVMRQLHEMLWYLSDASSRVEARSLHAAIAVVRQRIEALTGADRDTVLAIDVAAWRSEVGPILRAVSELVRGGSGSGGPDRSGADLSGADLSGADLSGQDLSLACLRGAHLIGANLRGADLRAADLLGADLRGADLRRADLRGALFLTQVQVNAAIGDGGTGLPWALRRPRW